MVNSESNGKVALITGANKGLGLEMSRQLGQHGLTILIPSSVTFSKVNSETLTQWEFSILLGSK